MRKKISLVALGMIPLVFLQAQDSLKTTTLNEVVISAVRSEQHVMETPRSVSVINQATLEKSVYNSVGELLSAQEGIYVVGGNQTPGTNQSLFMRGANSNQVVVMMDGVRITDPSSPNAAIDLSELSLTNVERIEIVRGAHSTLYGGSAIGGVVNIITKKNGAKGFHGNVSAQAGAYGSGSSTFVENASINYSLGKSLYADASIFQQNTNGLNASMNSTPPGGFSTTDKEAFRKTDGFVKTGFKNISWDAFVLYKKTNQKADIDQGAFVDDDNNYVDFKRDFWQYNLGYAVTKNLRISAVGSWSDLKRLNENDSSVVDEDGNTDRAYFKGTYQGKLQTHELQLNYETKKLKSVLGGGLYAEEMFFNTYFFSNGVYGPYESIVDYDSIDTSAKTSYVFAQAGYGIGKFNLSGGTRFSHHSRFGNYWTFEVNPSYRLKTVLVYGSLSSGYNAPSLYQLFDLSQGYGSYTKRGNRKLKPEESMSVELGIKKEFASGVYFTLSAFQTTTKNSIEYIYLWKGATPVESLDYTDYRGDTYVNIAEQKTSGLEVKGYVPFLSRFFVSVNASWLKGSVIVSPDDIDAEQTGGNHVQLYNYGTFLTEEITKDDLVRRPSATAFAHVGYSPIANLTLSAYYRYASSRYDAGYDPDLGPYGALTRFNIEAYSLLDFGTNWQINKNVSLGMKVENILNEDYQEIAGFQTRGRSAYLKLTLKW